MDSFDQMRLIQARLNSLRQEDKHVQTFGANGHKYLLNPPLTSQEVSAFEQKHAIVLPEDYRNFLLFIGNGGAGPGYGLFQLHNYDRELSDLPSDFLSRPFLLQTLWQPDCDTVDNEAPDEEHAYFGNYWVQGTMRICHLGCGIYILLVVSGPERGNIWVDDRGSDNGISPLEQDFLTWYLSWLDDSLQKLAQKIKFT